MHPPATGTDEVLERLFARYRRAMSLNTTAAPDLRVVDEVITARVTLYEHLVRQGWDPPPVVRRMLATALLLLVSPPTAVAG